MKKSILIGFLIVTGINFAQTKKELTLKDAVSQQGRSLAAKSLFGFAWVPSSIDYTYLEGFQTLVRSSVLSTQEEKMTIQDFNKLASAELNWFSGFEWLNKNEWQVTDGVNYYIYSVSAKSVKKIAIADKEAENATLNNSSKHIAYTLDNNLFIQSNAGKKIQVTNEPKEIVSGQFISRSEFGITQGIFWSPKGTFLAFYQKDERKVAEYPLLNISETPGKLKSIRYPMAGQSSENVKVGIRKIGAKKNTFISPRNGAENYLTNVSWSNDEQFIIVAEVNRDQNHVWVNKYDSKGTYIATLFEEKNDKWAEPEHPAHFFSSKNNDFIWVSERDGFNNLYHYDINGTLKKQLTANKFVVKQIVKNIADEAIIYFTATGVDPKNTVLYKIDLNGNQTLLTQSEGVHTAIPSPDGSYIFDQYSNLNTPGISQILKSDGTVAKGMITATNPLSDYAIGTVEYIQIKSEDNQDLHGRIVKPSNFDATKKYPVLVYVYGGPHAQMVTNEFMGNVDYWMLWMAEQGYIVYTLDNRGSGERGTTFEQVIHRQLGTAEISDQMKGIDYLKSLPFIDANRIAVHGWSFGGFMTTSLLLREPNTFKVGVAGGPVTDWKYYEIMYAERYMDRPEENLKGYEKANTLTYADKLKGKLLLIHGTIDDVVVMQHSEALIKRFVEVEKQMDFFVYPMHEHNVRGKDRVHLMTKVLTYIIENNK